MKLSNSIANKSYVITKITGEYKIRIRLLTLGIIKNTRITVLNKKADALIIQVRGTRIGISKKIADLIQVKEETKENERVEGCVCRKS